MADPSDKAFRELVAPHERALRVHCYRMLGSSHDSDDVLQETLTRAWRARDSIWDKAQIRPWLYRIATNACLDELARRPRRELVLPEHFLPPSPGDVAPAPAIEEPTWLEPCPDAWLDPSARAELKESVALAFVAALQALSPPQRAVLLLREVLGFSAEETAEALELSVSAANSALHRARTAVEKRLKGRAPRDEAIDEELLRRYVRAWESADVTALIALLHDEITTTMPPSPTWMRGKDATATFFTQRLFPRITPGMMVLVRTAANGLPAFGVYTPDEQRGGRSLHAIHIVEPRDGKVVSIHHFMTPAVFALFGLEQNL